MILGEVKCKDAYCTECPFNCANMLHVCTSFKRDEPLFEGLKKNRNNFTAKQIINIELCLNRKDFSVCSSDKDILNALQTLGFKYIARDANGDLFAYKDKPQKFISSWKTNGEYTSVKKSALSSVKWEHKTPTEIGGNENE